MARLATKRGWFRACRWLSLACALCACRERSAGEAPAKQLPCAEVGQRCEVSPGKLGSCVQRDDCKGANCFVCQSQH